MILREFRRNNHTFFHIFRWTGSGATSTLSQESLPASLSTHPQQCHLQPRWGSHLALRYREQRHENGTPAKTNVCVFLLVRARLFLWLLMSAKQVLTICLLGREFVWPSLYAVCLGNSCSEYVCESFDLIHVRTKFLWILKDMCGAYAYVYMTGTTKKHVMKTA